MQTIRVQGSGFTRLISRQSGAGSILVTNTSLTVTVFLTDKDVGNPATADSVTLGPNASKTFDGSSDVYGFVTGGFADVEVIEGGVATFLGLTQSSGALVLPSIRSPNFNIDNPPASPANSWALLSNGLAYVFGLILSGGTITGPDYIFDSTGLFVYSGTPAVGNLIASIAPPSTAVDPKGNTLRPTITAYSDQNGSFVQLLPGTAGSGQASMNIGSGNSAEAVPLKVLSQVSGAGATRQIVTTMRAPRVTGESVSAACSILLFSESADLTIPALLSMVVTDDAGVNTSAYNQTPTGFSFGNQPLTSTGGTPAKPTVVNTDSWHTMTPLLNGWAAAGAPNAPPQYRLGINNYVEIAGTLNGAAATAATFFTLPAGYRPALRQVAFAAGATGNVAANRAPFVQLDTAGNLTLTGAAALPAAGVFVFSGVAPLDLG